MIAAPGDAGRVPFSLELTVPLRALTAFAGAPLALALVLAPGASVPGKDARRLALVALTLVGLNGHGPHLAQLDLLESTDSVLFDAPERRLFDLQNPEEGLWLGTGKWRLRLFADWTRTEGEAASYALDARPSQITHRWMRADDGPAVVVEDATRRAGGRRTYAELTLDTSHPDVGPVPHEGKDVPLDLVVEHALTFGEHAAVCTWYAALPLRVRDPLPLLKSFQRLSAVGIDFGTTATVAALYQKGYRSLMRLGGSTAPGAKGAENPTYLLVEDHEKLWVEIGRRQPPASPTCCAWCAAATPRGRPWRTCPAPSSASSRASRSASSISTSRRSSATGSASAISSSTRPACARSSALTRTSSAAPSTAPARTCTCTTGSPTPPSSTSARASCWRRRSRTASSSASPRASPPPRSPSP